MSTTFVSTSASTAAASRHTARKSRSVAPAYRSTAPAYGSIAAASSATATAAGSQAPASYNRRAPAKAVKRHGDCIPNTTELVLSLFPNKDFGGTEVKLVFTGCSDRVALDNCNLLPTSARGEGGFSGGWRLTSYRMTKPTIPWCCSFFDDAACRGRELWVAKNRDHGLLGAVHNDRANSVRCSRKCPAGL